MTSISIERLDALERMADQQIDAGPLSTTVTITPGELRALVRLALRQARNDALLAHDRAMFSTQQETQP